MSEQPEDAPEDTRFLFRRAAPRSMDERLSSVRPEVFRLRVSRGESALSFYDSRLVTPQEVLDAAPAAGWGVAAVTVGILRALSFELQFDGQGGAGLEAAHISAFPPNYQDGQIPHAIRQALAAAAVWAVQPAAD